MYKTAAELVPSLGHAHCASCRASGALRAACCGHGHWAAPCSRPAQSTYRHLHAPTPLWRRGSPPPPTTASFQPARARRYSCQHHPMRLRGRLLTTRASTPTTCQRACRARSHTAQRGPLTPPPPRLLREVAACCLGTRRPCVPLPSFLTPSVWVSFPLWPEIRHRCEARSFACLLDLPACVRPSLVPYRRKLPTGHSMQARCGCPRACGRAQRGACWCPPACLRCATQACGALPLGPRCAARWHGSKR